MPWDVTDQYIRSGHRDSGDPCRTITLSAAQGIKAIYCKYGGKWAIQSYLFARAKGWDLSKAKTWFSQHRAEKFEEILREGFSATVASSPEERDVSIHPDFLRMRAIFVRRFGEVAGTMRYLHFVTMNDLHQDRRYHPSVQFHESVGLNESFGWATPLITYLRQDKDAKYYAVTTLTANLSMNNNDYTDPEKMAKAAISMNFMPVNLNHNHNTWFRYPHTRLDWAKFEDMAVEGILRVDNREQMLQKMLDHDPSIPEKLWINHPSIEARPIPPHMGGGYHFTGIALLQKGYSLPGDPCTDIQPLFMESVHDSLEKQFLVTCKIVDGKILCKEEKSLNQNNEVTEQTANDKTGNEDTVSNEAESGMEAALESPGSEITGEEAAWMAEKSKMNKSFFEAKEELNGTIKTLTTELGKANEKLESATKKANKAEILEEKLGKAEGDKADLEAQLQIKEGELLETRKEVLKREESISSKKEELKEVNTRLGQLKTQLETAREKLKAANIDLAKANAEVEEACKARNRAKEDLSEALGSNTSISKQFSEMVDKREAAEKDLNALQKEFDRTKAEHGRAVKAFEAKLEKLTDESTAKTDELTKALEATREELKLAREDKEKLDKEVIRLGARVRQKRQEDLKAGKVPLSMLKR